MCVFINECIAEVNQSRNIGNKAFECLQLYVKGIYGYDGVILSTIDCVDSFVFSTIQE